VAQKRKEPEISADVAFKRVPEKRSAGEKFAERQAWQSGGTQEERIARMNKVREAFTGVRLSSGPGIGGTKGKNLFPEKRRRKAKRR